MSEGSVAALGGKVMLLAGQDNNIIFNGCVSALPVSEEGIKKKSRELFNDGEPCIIHRTYIIKKFYFDMEQYMDHLLNKRIGKVSYNKLPVWIREMIGIKGEMKVMFIKHL